MGKKDQSFGKSSTPFKISKAQRFLFQNLSEQDKNAFYFKNLSLNSSLSYTLNHFITKVQIEEADKDSCSPFKKNPFQGKKLYDSSVEINFENKLSLPAQKKFLHFFQFLKRFFFIPGHYTIFSQNNFPTAIGTASSASSFSALSLAVYKLAKARSTQKKEISYIKQQDLAGLSRIGSGSSIRSFFSPWCIWTHQNVQTLKSPWSKLLHQLIVVNLQEKKISSTKAHERVKTSPYFKRRKERAERRIKSLLSAFQIKDWKQCYQICYKEFMDLHTLFESSKPPVKYRTDNTYKVLDYINYFWKKNKDGPIATMDAGANIHLLYRPDQRVQREEIKKEFSNLIVLSSL